MQALGLGLGATLYGAAIARAKVLPPLGGWILISAAVLAALNEAIPGAQLASRVLFGLAFVVLDTIATTAPSWILYLMTRVQDFSFTIAGLIMISVTAGIARWRQLRARLTKWRIPPRWYLFALVPVALYGAAAVTANGVEDGEAVLDGTTVATILFSLSAGLLVTLFLRGAMGEELGLRGFALPRLQQRTTPTQAALIIGVAWAGWHLPAFLDNEPVTVAVLVLLIVGLSYIFTMMFNGSGGSLIPPLLFHATQNWEEAFETIFPSIIDTDW